MELWLLQRFSHFKGVSRHEKTRQVASLFLLSLLLIVRSIMTLNFLTRVELVGLHFFFKWALDSIKKGVTNPPTRSKNNWTSSWENHVVSPTMSAF